MVTIRFMHWKLSTQLVAALSTLAAWLAGGTILFHYLEKWTWIQSFYFSVVTLTTIGYGDLYPTTDFTRLVTALYILSGVAIALASLSIIGTHYLTDREKDLLERRKNIEKRFARKKRFI